MHQVTGLGHLTAVRLPDDDNCFETELVFELIDDDCVAQIVQMIYGGESTDFVLRVFRNDDGNHFLEMESCSDSDINLSADDLLRIQNIVRSINRKYDLSVRTANCPAKPYFRH